LVQPNAFSYAVISLGSAALVCKSNLRYLHLHFHMMISSYNHACICIFLHLVQPCLHLHFCMFSWFSPGICIFI
jgi:hypothetical protein